MSERDEYRAKLYDRMQVALEVAGDLHESGIAVYSVKRGIVWKQEIDRVVISVERGESGPLGEPDETRDWTSTQSTVKAYRAAYWYRGDDVVICDACWRTLRTRVEIIEEEVSA